ncbi:MAG: glycosyltransferase family 4 protein [Nitrososphaerota archaeon]
MKRHVVVITPDPFPPDVRIEREIETLAKHGYKVSVISTKGQNSSKKNIPKDVSVIYINCREFKGFPIINWKKLHGILLELKPDIIHLHNIKLAPYVIPSAKLLKVPIIFDDHEIWVNLCFSLKINSLLKLMVAVIYFVIELATAIFATKIITVCDEAKKLFSRLFLVPPHKIVVIENFESVEKLNKIAHVKVKDDRLMGKFIVCYVGGLEDYRGVKELLNALPLLDDLKDIIVLIIGGSPSSKNYLSENLRILITKYESKVIFTGWLPFEEAMAYLRISNIACLLHEPNIFTNNTLPNKITQYLFFRKPVISTPLQPITRLFGDCVYVLKDLSSRSIARAIRYLYQNPNVAEALSHRGYVKVMKETNWEKVSYKLIKLYSDILQKF